MARKVLTLEERVEGLFKRTKHFHQYKGKSDEEIKSIIRALEQAKDDDGLAGSDVKKENIDELELDALFPIEEERRSARKLAKKYLSTYVIETVSDRNTLVQLLFLEMMNFRLQASINKVYEEAKIIPMQQLDALHKNLQQIGEAKEKLGITRAKLDDTKKDTIELLDTLKKKFKKYREQNQLSRNMVCIAKNSKVLMGDFSLKNIQEIREGDEILGTTVKNKEGLLLVKQKVKKTYNKGYKKVLKLKTENGKELICTPEHVIYSRLIEDKKRPSPSVYLEAEKSLGRSVRVFHGIEDINKYYEGVLLGFIESDGWCDRPKHLKWNFSKKYHICQSELCELDSLEYILNTLKIKYTKKFRDNGFGKGAFYYSLSTQNNVLIDKIEENLLKNKDLSLGFLAGFVLGDGYVDSTGNIHIAQKNKVELLEKVLSFLNFYYSKNSRANKMFSYRIGKQLPFNVPFSKKCEKYNEILLKSGSHFVEEKIVSVELLEDEVEVFDLTTETHNFIVDGFIVHNCPHCGQMCLLKMRTEHYDTIKHPYFKDRILFNENLIKLYVQGKITRKEVADVLGCSTDYVGWMLNKAGMVDDKGLEDLNLKECS